MKNLVLDVNDVGKILKRKPTYCYKVIRELNAELKEQGYFINEGRVPAKYFYERMNIEPEDLD